MLPPPLFKLARKGALIAEIAEIAQSALQFPSLARALTKAAKFQIVNLPDVARRKTTTSTRVCVSQSVVVEIDHDQIR